MFKINTIPATYTDYELFPFVQVIRNVSGANNGVNKLQNY